MSISRDSGILTVFSGLHYYFNVHIVPDLSQKELLQAGSYTRTILTPTCYALSLPRLLGCPPLVAGILFSGMHTEFILSKCIQISKINLLKEF